LLDKLGIVLYSYTTQIDFMQEIILMPFNYYHGLCGSLRFAQMLRTSQSPKTLAEMANRYLREVR